MQTFNPGGDQNPQPTRVALQRRAAASFNQAVHRMLVPLRSTSIGDFDVRQVIKISPLRLCS
jgi:hypothetical protein